MRDGAEAGSLASTVQRLAVLLAAGVAPTSAWSYLEPDARTGRLAVVVAAMDRGVPVSVAIMGAVGERGEEASPWRALAAAWQVATEAGAPLAPTLRALAGTLRDLDQAARDARTALAAPKATARMVLALPVVGLLFGLAMGFDTVGTLFTTVPGLVCLGAGLVLMLVARWWNARLVRSARPTETAPGLTLDLVAIAVSGGAALPRALAAVERARHDCGLPTDRSRGVVAGVLELSGRAGVPAAELLRSEAEECRREAKSEAERKSAALAVRLMLPLGICVLPAFMLLGVAPLLISVVTSTVSSF